MAIPFQVIIHGGANKLIDETDTRMQACQEIMEKTVAFAQQKNDTTALDICEEAIKHLEDNILFNAGTGAYLQIDGVVRMDASIMDSQLRLGSVIQIENVKHPISVARALLERPMHCSLTAHGANQFAEEMGFESYNPETEKKRAMHEENMKNLEGELRYDAVLKNYEKASPNKLGTVGCVVRDTRTGMIVAGTSTGGIRVCYPGRVGDSGLVGNGTYANEYVGVSCTGVGEKIMRITLARLVSFHLEAGKSLAEACAIAIEKLGSIQGDGGLIAISHKGEIVYKHNTPTMSYAIYDGQTS